MHPQSHKTQRRRSSDTLEILRAELSYRGLSGVVIPRFDPHQAEQCAPHDERLAFVTGFTGSAGMAIVMLDVAALFVDGRYQVQAENEVDADRFSIEHFFDAPPDDWLAKRCRSGERIGFNPMLFPGNWYKRLSVAASAAGAILVEQESDPVDAIWTDQPLKPAAPIRPFGPDRAGETSREKRARIARELSAMGADYLIEAQPDNIAWLLNVRGADIAYNPVPHSFLVLDREGRAEWFVDHRKLPNALDDYELDDVTCREPDALWRRAAEISSGKAVVVDPDFAPVRLGFAVERNAGTLLSVPSPLTLAKAVKNEIELEGFRACHVEDGAALASFMAWLEVNVGARHSDGRPIREYEAETQLLAFRQERDGFMESSFRTISAFGPNAAMCHFSASTSASAAITPHGLYLLDSGGQYNTGTTDVTRTTSFGPVGDDIRTAYTAVLKGFISLLTLKFPRGTCGHHIDAFARRALWDMGLDYDHGTGHSVGHVLSYHEQPHRIGKGVNNIALTEGMIVTIEPGYYEAGRFGIRIENQVEIAASADGFLCFKSLTLAPIDLRLARLEQLDPSEIRFLNDYHRQVHDALAPLVDADTRTWLERLTKSVPIT